MKKQESQLKKVKSHLLSGRSITPIDALNLYGSFRLAALVHVLRHQEGMDIVYDETEGYGRYSIETKK
jgi:hypothetical protein